MRLKIIALSAIFLFFGQQASYADSERVILDELITGDAPVINLEDLDIPADLEAGYHEILIEVYDDSGVLSSKTALFCKTKTGELKFDNICPDLIEGSSDSTVVDGQIINNPEKTFSLLALITGFMGAILFARKPNEEVLSVPVPEYGELGSARRKKNWGDRLWHVNKEFNTSLDTLPRKIAAQLQNFALVFSRAVLDARYLRAIFGNFSWITIPISLVATYIGLLEISSQAKPLSVKLTAILLLVGIFDSFAGLCGAILYLNFLFANGNLITLNSVLFASVYCMLFFVPSMLASKIRLLHRKLTNFNDFWERLTDYFVIPLLVGWFVATTFSSLSSYFAFEVEIQKYAIDFGLLAGLSILVRLILEDLAWHGFPYRISNLHFELNGPNNFQKIVGIASKVFLFVILVEPHVGFTRNLLIGLGILLLSQVLAFSTFNFPKLPVFAYLPKGTLRLVTLTVICLLLERYLAPQSSSVAEKIQFGILVLPIPGLIFSIFDLFTESRSVASETFWLKFSYRFFGVFIYFALVMMVLNVDLITGIPDFLVEIPSKLDSFFAILQNFLGNLFN